MSQALRPSVYSYSDYRKFLADSYVYAKENDYGFSFRVFSRRAGISASNYLRLVIDGKRNLTLEMAARFAKALGLTDRAAEFFCELVAYNQAKSTAEKNRHHRTLSRFREFRQVRKLDAQQAEYHSSWYVPVIRELARVPQFREDPEWIAAQLTPRISSAQAKSALQVLTGLGLLVKNAAGKLVQAEPLVSTGPGPLGHHIFNYHHAMLERAGVALDECPREEREVSSITVCVSHERMLELEQHVRQFRQKLLQFAEQGNQPERVVQLNFQVFPLSRSPLPAASGETDPSKKRKRSLPSSLARKKKATP